MSEMHHEHEHSHHSKDGTGAMAVAATLHCLTGCAIGEIAGLVIGTAAGLGNAPTVAVSILLAFVFGYALSTLPLVKGGLAVPAALGLVLAADTLSILTMEVVDNLVVVAYPGAMDAGLPDPTFWVSLLLSLVVAFVAAVPVNRFLLERGKGHALTHGHHGSGEPAVGVRRLLPSFRTSTLVATILAFVLGGLLVAIAG